MFWLWIILIILGLIAFIIDEGYIAEFLAIIAAIVVFIYFRDRKNRDSPQKYSSEKVPVDCDVFIEAIMTMLERAQEAISDPDMRFFSVYIFSCDANGNQIVPNSEKTHIKCSLVFHADSTDGHIPRANIEYQFRGSGLTLKHNEPIFGKHCEPVNGIIVSFIQRLNSFVDVDAEQYTNHRHILKELETRLVKINGIRLFSSLQRNDYFIITSNDFSRR